MEATLTPPDTATAGEVLERAVDARQRLLRAEADQLAVALEWGLLHEVEDPTVEEQRLGWPTSIPLAGEGTPWVDEFAVAELAASLGLTEASARGLVGDALEIAFRLPLLWARVQSGRLPAWRSRRVADRTRGLSVEAAGWVDRQVAPFAHQLSEGRVRDLIDAALLRFHVTDPAGEPPVDGRGADFVAIEGGQVYLRALLDAADGRALESTLSKVADILHALGDDESVDVLRSKALGILADPQLSLDLLSGVETDPTHRVRLSAGSPATALTLYVHVSAHDLAAGKGVARVEGIGPVSLDQIAEWTGKARLSIRPVLDLNACYVADGYEVPDSIREQILARDPACVFPWCGARTHRRDIDHITAYDDTGPPGQTASSNLAPLCRFHHRLKTHGRWTYHRHPGTGAYHWASPMGRHYTVDSRGTSTS